jgi:hypothetical protein
VVAVKRRDSSPSLVAVTARTVTQDVLAQADVVAAQLAETGGGLRAGAGCGGRRCSRAKA